MIKFSPQFEIESSHRNRQFGCCSKAKPLMWRQEQRCRNKRSAFDRFRFWNKTAAGIGNSRAALDLCAWADFVTVKLKLTYQDQRVHV